TAEAQLHREVEQLDLCRRQTGMPVVAEDPVNLVFRFAQDAQHLVVRRGAVAVALRRRKYQEKPLLLALGKSGLRKEDGGREGNVALNKARQQARRAVPRRYVPKIVPTGQDRCERRTQLDLSGETHVLVILAPLVLES